MGPSTGSRRGAPLFTEVPFNFYLDSLDRAFEIHFPTFLYARFGSQIFVPGRIEGFFCTKLSQPKVLVGGPEIIEMERLLTCDLLLPEVNSPRGMIGNTRPSEVCFRVRESGKPTVINQHSVKLPGNNPLTISAVGKSVERALKRYEVAKAKFLGGHPNLYLRSIGGGQYYDFSHPHSSLPHGIKNN